MSFSMASLDRSRKGNNRWTLTSLTKILNTNPEHDDRGGQPPQRARGGRRGRGDRGRGRGNDRDHYWDDGSRWQRGGGGGGSRGSRGAPYRSGYRDDGPGPRSRLEDEDAAMGGDDLDRPKSQNRYNPYGGRRPRRGGRRGSSRGRGSYPNRTYNRATDGDDALMRDSSSSKWFKVTIPYGAKHSKTWLLKSITNLCKVPFEPVDYTKAGSSVIFFIDDGQASRALADVSKRITTTDGYKVVLLVRPSGPPPSVSGGPKKGSTSAIVFSEEDKQALTEVMSKRYDPSSKLLNLSDFFNDEDLKSKSIRCAPNQLGTMTTILEVLFINIPETVGIDLSSNRLYSLYSCKQLPEKAPNVTSINLTNNNLKNIDDLKILKGLRLTELLLDKNPLCDAYQDKVKYIRAVRGMFRDVTKLDGHDLEPEISFDIEETTKLPQAGPSFFPDDEIKKTILQFLERYYIVFDSESRTKLIDVYHDQAKFSMSIPYDLGGGWVKGNLMHHFSDSRNMKNDKQKYKAQKLLKQGRLAVAAFLSELPPTQHDLNSFLVDVSLVQPVLMHFTVNGVLFEVDKSKTKIAFSRAFVVCPGATGLVILNDHLTYRQPSEKQKKDSFATPAPTPTHSPVGAAPGPSHVVSPVAAVPAPVVPDVTLQQQMVQQFIKDSGMIAAYSQRCLEENGWDYPKAGEVFLSLKTGGNIPPEAFIQQP